MFLVYVLQILIKILENQPTTLYAGIMLDALASLLRFKTMPA